MWTLRGLLDSASSAHTEIDGQWVPSRPTDCSRSLWKRVKEAWSVFTGRADCFLWPKGQ